MKKVLISIKKDTLKFKYVNRISKNKAELLNTNVISSGELLFSDTYIKDNQKIVSLFLKELIVNSTIKNIEVDSTTLGELIITTLQNINNIENFNIYGEDSISFTLAEQIVKNDNIKKVGCHTSPEYIIEYFDKYGIILESRSELFFTSNFMQINELTEYSKLFYKKNLKIPINFLESDLEDFKIFCKINKYLKTIEFDKADSELLKKLITVLTNYKLKNIKIIINDNITNEDDIIELRKLNKNKNNITIKVFYTKEYIKNNFLRQLIINALKFLSLFTLTVIVIVFGYITYNNYQSYENIEEITKEVETIIEQVTNEQNQNIDPEKPEEVEGTHGPSVINELLTLNPDTIGWITVNGTKIDYPIVQTIDNSYYLTKNYKKQKDYSGWVFADYRNNISDLDDNTIIYAHNRYSSDVMFGTLQDTLTTNWLNNEDNYIITFNTLYEEMQFEVFSIYKINTTSDYIVTNFQSDSSFNTFINLITNRSEHDFNVSVNPGDKVLTLSTCFENDRRFVLHAKLITE